MQGGESNQFPVTSEINMQMGGLFNSQNKKVCLENHERDRSMFGISGILNSLAVCN